LRAASTPKSGPIEPEALADVLAAIAVAHEEHLLAAGQHAEQEAGEGVAAEFVLFRARLGVARLGAGEHGNKPPDRARKSNQNQTSARARNDLAENTHSQV
jgi:hypothetical protein